MSNAATKSAAILDASAAPRSMVLVECAIQLGTMSDRFLATLAKTADDDALPIVRGEIARRESL